MSKPLTFLKKASQRLVQSVLVLAGIFFASTLMGVGNSYYWDNDSGNDRWPTATNWVGDVAPGTSDDIFFEDDYGTGAQFVDTRGNRVVRSLNFDNPYAYTIEKKLIEFVAVTGTTTINVDDLNGVPASAIAHSIDSNIRFASDLTITNATTNVTLALNGRVDGQTTGNLIIEGGGTVLSGSGSDFRNIPSININNGTLLLGGSNNINNSVAVELGGGTLNTGGFDERVDTLTLSASSTIDLGAGASVLEFADSSAVSWTSGTVLTISNWSGSLTGGGTDQVIFRNSSASLTATQVSQIRFLNPAGLSAGTYGAQILTNGEIVPVPVPEPSTIIIGGLLAFVGLGDVYRRYRKHKQAIEEASEETDA